VREHERAVLVVEVRLFTALALARGDGHYAKLLRALSRVKLLILDDWGPETLAAFSTSRNVGGRREGAYPAFRLPTLPLFGGRSAPLPTAKPRP
jgi:hypothetical protein